MSKGRHRMRRRESGGWRQSVPAYLRGREVARIVLTIRAQLRPRNIAELKFRATKRPDALVARNFSCANRRSTQLQLREPT